MSGYSYKQQDIGYGEAFETPARLSEVKQGNKSQKKRQDIGFGQVLEDDSFQSLQAFKTPAKNSQEMHQNKRTSRSEDEKYYGCYRTQHIECTDTVTAWQVNRSG